MSVVLTVIVIVIVVALLLLKSSVRLVQQYERGVVLRFGRLLPVVREPGLQLLIPFADRMTKVSQQTIVMGIPAQNAITRDNVTLTVDAVVYFKVVDPVKAVINVEDYIRATSQVAQTSLRSVIGRADLDTLLSDREQINNELKAVIDAPTEEPWGLHIERVEVKDVALPEGMKRSMSRQAEAERERRARVIAADGEFQASTKLAQAARVMADTPARCSCVCFRPSSTSPPRRTAPWSCLSPSSCSGSSKKPPPPPPSTPPAAPTPPQPATSPLWFLPAVPSPTTRCCPTTTCCPTLSRFVRVTTSTSRSPRPACRQDEAAGVLPDVRRQVGDQHRQLRVRSRGVNEPGTLIELGHRETALPQRPSQPGQHHFPVRIRRSHPTRHHPRFPQPHLGQVGVFLPLDVATFNNRPYVNSCCAMHEHALRLRLVGSRRVGPDGLRAGTARERRTHGLASGFGCVQSHRPGGTACSQHGRRHW